MRRLTLTISGNVQKAGQRDRVIELGRSLGLLYLSFLILSIGTASLASAQTQITLSIEPSQPVVGEAVTITANLLGLVPGPSLPAPIINGTVVFYDNNVEIGRNRTVLNYPTGAASIEYTFSTSGTHVLRAYYPGDAGYGANNATLNINVAPDNVPPVATFTANTPVQAFVNVVANPNGTYDANGDPITLTWSWGDGTTTTTTSAAPVTHQYNRAGTYTITLSVFDGTYTSTYTRTVQVTNDGIVLSFKQGWNQIAIPISSATPLGVLFAGVPGYVQTWTWNGATQIYVSVGGSAPVVGKGYFVFASAPYDLIIRGTGVSKTAADIQSSLVAGWNMVGPGIDTIVLSEQAYNYDPANSTYAATQTLVPGKGYWIWADNNS